MRPVFAALFFAMLALTLLPAAQPARGEMAAEGNVAAEPAAPTVPANDAGVAAVPVTPEGNPATPAADGDYICTPGFTLAEVDGMLRLKGSIETPTPGFAYEITDIDQTEKGKVSGILRLSPPSGGAVIQVISHIDIGFDVPVETSEFTGLTLGLEKSFGWGISSIACSPVADGDVPPQ